MSRRLALLFLGSLLAACETGRPSESLENENRHLHGVIRAQEKRIDDLTAERRELERRVDDLEAGGSPTMSKPGLDDEPEDPTAPAAEGRASSELQAQVEAMLERFKSDSDVEVEQTADGYRFVLREKVLFGAASATLSDDGGKALERVAEALRGGTTMVLVEGHTDDVKITKPETLEKFPRGNIELSVARALAVWQFLSTRLEPERLAVIGYGEHRPRVPNDSERNRYRNRRVEIRVTDAR